MFIKSRDVLIFTYHACNCAATTTTSDHSRRCVAVRIKNNERLCDTAGIICVCLPSALSGRVTVLLETQEAPAV